METINKEILQIITAFNLGTFKSSTSKNSNKYTITEFTTSKGIFKHYFLND